MLLVNCYGLMIAQNNFILLSVTFQLSDTMSPLWSRTWLNSLHRCKSGPFRGLQFTEPEEVVQEFWGNPCFSLQSAPNSCCLERVSLCSPSWLQTNPPSATIIDVSNHTYLYLLVYFTASITAQALKIEILVSDFSPTLLLAQSVLRGKQDGGQNLITDE